MEQLRTLIKLFSLPSEKGPFLEGKNSFLLEQTSFQKRLGVYNSKQNRAQLFKTNDVFS